MHRQRADEASMYTLTTVPHKSATTSIKPVAQLRMLECGNNLNSIK
jgi:hypothetical protein